MSSGNAGPPSYAGTQEPRKRRSRWLWWVYLGCGSFSWIGFVVVATKVRTRKFVRAAVVSVVLTGIGIVAAGIWPPADEVLQETDPNANVALSSYHGVWVVAAVWIILIIYGHVLNHDYKKFLRAKDDQDRGRLGSLRDQAPTYYPPPASATTTAPPPPTTSGSSTQAAPPVDSSRVEADRYFASQPPGNAPSPVPPNAPQA